MHLHICLPYDIRIFPDTSSSFGSVTDPVASIIIIIIIGQPIQFHPVLIKPDAVQNIISWRRAT